MEKELRQKNTEEFGFHIISNIFTDIYGPRIGVYAISIYDVLKRHFNKSTSVSFPSIKRIAYLIKANERSVVRHIKCLSEYNIIYEIRKCRRNNSQHKYNTYYLSEPKDWILPSDLRINGSMRVSDLSQSDLKYINQMTHSRIKKTNINKTNKGINFIETKKEFDKIMRNKQVIRNSYN